LRFPPTPQKHAASRSIEHFKSSLYLFLEVVGEGGFGEVLRCVNKETGNVVAIKMPKFKQCCKREVRIQQHQI
uniref:Protein kinase domain-containing protein n=1 Tax=Labrus bergylta TaxID=56723 RepID=A0A3Q3G9A2_9LABR